MTSVFGNDMRMLLFSHWSMLNSNKTANSHVRMIMKSIT